VLRFLSVPLLLAAFLFPEAEGARTRPNVLLVLSDDHSVPHLGCYGSPNAVTPNLDAFATEGMRFERAYTTAPQCAPSRTSIFAGRSPVALGVTRFAQPAPHGTVFFTDILREHGYFTALAGRWHHLSGKAKESPERTAALAEAGLDYIGERFDHIAIDNTKGDRLPGVGAAFTSVLDHVPEGKPFFLYFGFNQPHRKWVTDSAGLALDPAALVLPPDFPDLPEVRTDYANFLFSVHDLDKGFGGIMKVLEARGLARNTLVIFMGDNGEALLRGKGTLYDRGCHVPLLVRWPGVVKPGSSSGALVSGQDLAATILEAAGLDPHSTMDSRSFLPALRGEAFGGHEALFLERSQHGFDLPGENSSFDLSRAVVTRDHLFIYNALHRLPYYPVDMLGKPAWRALVAAHGSKALSPLHERLYFSPRRPMFELFELASDPYQLTNLAEKKDETESVKNLRRQLAAWMIREGDYLPLP
jgi:arylsulfatase A-like enzyme